LKQAGETMQIIADPGSTHFGDLNACIEHIRQAAKYSLWGVKFQLCEEKNGNKPIKPEWLRKLVDIGDEVGVEVFASVWNEEGLQTVFDAGCFSVKFAYSMRMSPLIFHAKQLFHRVFVTRSIMDYFVDADTNNLWTVTDNGGALYPVVHPVTHTKAMYRRFDGFSCHALDVRGEIKRARKAGCEWFEFHSRLGFANDFDVPDGRFASTYREALCAF